MTLDDYINLKSRVETRMKISVMTSTGEIVLTDIKPFGKKRMDARSYINGIHDNNLIGKVLK